MTILSDSELKTVLNHLPSWTIAEGKLTREWTFEDFAGAMEFVNQVAAAAEASNHHPDIDIRYNRVRLSLISYDVGGLTKRDVRLAERISAYVP